MARPKEFDVDLALERAMDVFWVHGYEATSLPMLLEATGIGRQSLYDTFGGKRELFLAALDRYDAKVAEAIVAPLVADDAERGGLAAIRAYFDEAVLRLTREKPCRACLVANATMELAPRDAEITARVARSIRRIETALRMAVVRGQERGEIGARHEPRALARFLASVGFGLAVAAKAGATRKALRETVDVALGALA